MKVFLSKLAAWYTNDRPNTLSPATRGDGGIYGDIIEGPTSPQKGVKTEEEVEKMFTGNNKKKRKKIKKNKKRNK